MLRDAGGSKSCPYDGQMMKRAVWRGGAEKPGQMIQPGGPSWTQITPISIRTHAHTVQYAPTRSRATNCVRSVAVNNA